VRDPSGAPVPRWGWGVAPPYHQSSVTDGVAHQLEGGMRERRCRAQRNPRVGRQEPQPVANDGGQRPGKWLDCLNRMAPH
jgi:hypothetical protein